MITEKLGGRKFLLALIAIVVGTVIEVKGPNGLSANMAGLLAGIVGLFGAANAIVTSKAMSVASEEEQPATSLTGNDINAVAGVLSEEVAKIREEIAISNAKLVETMGNVGLGVANTNKMLRVAMGHGQPTE
jgi:F0F1-type ATP synthase membrane subunit c/vacuolar-type H+-ATPase subunit K